MDLLEQEGEVCVVVSFSHPVQLTLPDVAPPLWPWLPFAFPNSDAPPPPPPWCHGLSCQAAHAIQHLIEPSTRDAVIAAGALPRLIPLLNHSDAPDLQLAATITLNSLASTEEGVEAILSGGGTQLLIELLEVGPGGWTRGPRLVRIGRNGGRGYNDPGGSVCRWMAANRGRGPSPSLRRGS